MMAGPSPVTARAFWTVMAGRGEIRTETLSRERDECQLVRTIASGISRGTESLVFEGRVPPSQYQSMRAPLMAGAFPFPVKYGYSAVGRTPDGRRVFVLHPHQDAFLAPAGDVHSCPGRRSQQPSCSRRQHGDCAECRMGCRGASG